MSKLLQLIQKMHAGFVKIVSYLQPVFLLAVRLYWGWQLATNGWAKLHNLGNVTDFFTSLNLPHPHQTAIFVSTVEFVGGILLAAGLFSRVTSAALSIDMFMAYFVADRDALKAIFSDPGKFYGADPYTFLFAALLILIFGPGWISLDTLFTRMMSKRSGRYER